MIKVDTIRDSKKQVDTSSDPKKETHIIDRIRKLSIRPILFEPAIIGVIGQDLVMNVQKNLHMEISLEILSPLNTISSKDIVTGTVRNSAQVDRNIHNPSKVGNPEFNVDVFSPICGSNFSFTIWSRNIEPLDTFIDGFSTQERNSDFSCI